MPEFRTGQLLRIFIDHNDHWHGQPLYTAIVEMLRKNKIAGATVFQGIEGFGSHNQVHIAKVFTWANLPILIEVVDEAEAIERVLPKLREMLCEGMITLEQVQFARFEGARR